MHSLDIAGSFGMIVKMMVVVDQRDRSPHKTRLAVEVMDRIGIHIYFIECWFKIIICSF